MLWYMTSEQLFVSFCVITTVTYICGWMMDRIMGYGGFGVFGNWLILLMGCYVGMYVYNSMGYMLHWNPPMTIAVVGGVACVLLILMAMVKAVVSE